MRTGKLLAFMLTLSTLGATGCVVRATRGSYHYGTYGYASARARVGYPGMSYVQTLPPDPIYEDIPAAPGYGMVWIDGYWDWNGSDWYWIEGHWESQRDGYVYVEPYYDYSDGGYVYCGGYWETSNNVPSTIVVT